MDVAAYIEMYERIGHRVYHGEVCGWVPLARGFHAALPLTVAQDPSGAERRRIRRSAAWIGCVHGCPEGEHNVRIYWHLCDDPSYDFGHLKGDTRRQTRRGLERTEVREIAWDILAREGAWINRDAAVRQGRRTLDSRMVEDEPWAERVAVFSDYADVHAFGGFVDGRLVAYHVAALVEGRAEGVHNMSHSDYLRHYPNNAVRFAMAQAMFRQYGAKIVTAGLITRRESLRKYKTMMGFPPVGLPCHMEVNFPFNVLRRFSHKFKVVTGEALDEAGTEGKRP